MEFYINKKKSKMDYYEDIMHHRRSVFTHSIPVFTTLLRPYELDTKSFYYEDTKITGASLYLNDYIIDLINDASVKNKNVSLLNRNIDTLSILKED